MVVPDYWTIILLLGVQVSQTVVDSHSRELRVSEASSVSSSSDPTTVPCSLEFYNDAIRHVHCFPCQHRLHPCVQVTVFGVATACDEVHEA